MRIVATVYHTFFSEHMSEVDIYYKLWRWYVWCLALFAEWGKQHL